MAEKVKLSEDGSSIDFVQSDSLPASLKKFRQSPEIEGFYRFIYENDLQSEAFDILDQIIDRRKASKGKGSPAKATVAKVAKEAAPVKPPKDAAAPKAVKAKAAVPPKAAKPPPAKAPAVKAVAKAKPVAKAKTK